MRKPDWMLRLAAGIFIFVAAAVSWSQFLWPPLARYWASESPGLLPVILDLLNPVSDIYPYPAGGWLFLLATFAILLIVLGLFRKVLAYIDHSSVGISVLETQMELVLETPDGAQATVRRKQTFHANRTGITAYSLIYKPDSPNGYIDTASLRLSSNVGGKNITQQLLRRGTSRFVDVKEMYSTPLPVSPFTTYLPNSWVRLLHSWGLFRGTVVERMGEVKYVNEYTGAEAIISLNASMRPVSNVQLKVTFPDGFEPAPADIKGFLLRETAVEAVDLTPSASNGTRSYEANVRSLYLATLQIQWTNRPGGTP